MLKLSRIYLLTGDEPGIVIVNDMVPAPPPPPPGGYFLVKDLSTGDATTLNTAMTTLTTTTVIVTMTVTITAIATGTATAITIYD